MHTRRSCQIKVSGTVFARLRHIRYHRYIRTATVLAPEQAPVNQGCEVCQKFPNQGL